MAKKKISEMFPTPCFVAFGVLTVTWYGMWVYADLISIISLYLPLTQIKVVE